MPILECQGISKHFGAIHALDDVSLTISAGEVVGLMGDNGAGKSTLVKIVAGNFPPTDGRLLVDGQPTVFEGPSAARRNGIEIVYQDLALCDNLPASINIFMGRELTPLGRAAARARLQGHEPARRRAVRRAEVGDAAARRRARDVRRPAAGGGDRPHAAVQSRRSC